MIHNGQNNSCPMVFGGLINMSEQLMLKLNSVGSLFYDTVIKKKIMVLVIYRPATGVYVFSYLQPS